MRSHSSQRQQSWCVPGQRNPVTRFLALATIFSTLLLTACSTAPRALSPAEADAAVQARWAAAPWPPKPLPDTNPNVPRERLPYFWPYPEVPAPKWPEPHPDAKPDRGMSRIEYFNKLCRLEAGEFIYRTVKDVDGYYIIRPRVSYFSNFAGALHSDRLLTDVYAVEDPYGTFQDHDSNAANLTTALGSPEEKGYRFIEAPVLDLASIPYPEYYFAAGYRPSPPYVREERLFARHPNDPTTGHVPSLTRDVLIRQGGSGAYARYERVTTRMVDEGQKLLFQRHWKGNPDLSDHPYGREVFFYPAAETIVPTLKSQYGIVWRGISRPLDREMGIAGGEVLVLDLKTNEILGVHRGFALVGSDPVPFGRYLWGTPLICPRNVAAPSILKMKVLQYPGYAPSTNSTR